MTRHNTLCCDRVGQGQEFYVVIEYFCVTIELGLGQEFYVATECNPMERFCVAIEQFYVTT